MATKMSASQAKTLTKPTAKPKKANPVGRPSSFKPEYSDLAKKFCLLGANDERLAQLFEVSVATISNWKNDYPKFLEALKEGKDIADANVAHSLYQRALGYEHPEDDIRTLSIGGGASTIVITPTIKRYPPDTGAATLWLKNRQPNVWRDKVESVVTGADGGPVQHEVKVKFV